jgi:ABC-type glutathione transport system ATPase component
MLVASAVHAPPDRAEEPFVRVAGIHTFYGKSHILHDVSLQLRAGEVVGLLGCNGAGKSTTLKSMMGLVPPARGRVEFAGRDITGNSPRPRADQLRGAGSAAAGRPRPAAPEALGVRRALSRARDGHFTSVLDSHFTSCGFTSLRSFV